MERAEKSRKKKNRRGKNGVVIHVEGETDTKKEGTPRKQKKSFGQLLLCLVSEFFCWGCAIQLSAS